MKKTVVELFAGVGGFRVGLNNIKSFNDVTGKADENSKWKIVWANQWEPSTKMQDAYNCYVTRFGDEHINNEDIATIDKNIIPNHNLLVGGFPCQDYSVARSLSNEKGIEGKKGVLFWEIAKILQTKKTPFFLLENVDRLLKSPASQRGRDFGIMIRTVVDLGYNLEWRVINAADYGRGQRRRRIFIFGWKNNTKYSNKCSEYEPEILLKREGLFAKSFPIIQNDYFNVKTDNILRFKDTVHMTNEYEFAFENSGIVIDGQVYSLKTEPKVINPVPIKDNLDKSDNVINYVLTDDKLDKFRYLRGSKKVERTKPNGEKYFYSEGAMSLYDDLSLPARTMLTSEKSTNRSTHLILDPNLNKIRYITPIEAERFQDFPDNWTNTGMTESKRYFMMGNALVTGLISTMEKQLCKIIDDEI